MLFRSNLNILVFISLVVFLTLTTELKLSDTEKTKQGDSKRATKRNKDYDYNQIDYGDYSDDDDHNSEQSSSASGEETDWNLGSEMPAGHFGPFAKDHVNQFNIHSISKVDHLKINASRRTEFNQV